MDRPMILEIGISHCPNIVLPIRRPEMVIPITEIFFGRIRIESHKNRLVKIDGFKRRPIKLLNVLNRFRGKLLILLGIIRHDIHFHKVLFILIA